MPTPITGQGISAPPKVDATLSNTSKNAVQNQAVANALAGAYDATATYAVGDLRIYDGILYECTTAITTAEAWDATHWKTSNFGDDVADLKRQLSDLEDTVATTQIVNTASGEIASFDDGADGQPIKKLVVNIEPKQDLHGYDSPWPAGGGTNKLAPAEAFTQTINGVTLACDGNGKYTLSGTATGGAASFTFPITATHELQSGEYFHIRNSAANGSMTISLMTASDNISYWGINPANRIIQLPDEYVGRTVARINIYAANGATADMTITPSIEANSSVTPYSPYSNICPISGWTGCEIEQNNGNFWHSDWVLIDTPLSKRDGVMECLTTNKPSTTYLLGGSQSDIEFYLPPGTYYLKFTSDTFTGYAVLEDGTAWYSGVSKTFADGAHIKAIRCNTVILDQGTYYWKLQISLGTSESDYEPYQGEEVSVTWEDEAGTVYGGTVDLVSGVLTAEYAEVDMGTLTWSYANSIFVAMLPSNSYKYASSVKAISDYYAFAGTIQNGTADMQGTADCSFALYYNANYPTSRVVYVKNTAYTDATAFKTAMNGHQLVYELAAPIETDITPTPISTLEGDNNIWSDGDSVEVEYCADTKLYIEKLTQPTEDDMIADHAISAGTFFMVGQKLYLSIASIASGAQIIEGTNAQRLSLADALNTLSS